MGIELKFVDEGHCDKCGKEVDPGNNAVYWHVAYGALQQGEDPVEALKAFAANPLNILGYTPRHLEAIAGCEGSPSRASMALEGMFSYENGARLPREQWKPLSKSEAAHAKLAYEIIKQISK